MSSIVMTYVATSVETNGSLYEIHGTHIHFSHSKMNKPNGLEI